MSDSFMRIIQTNTSLKNIKFSAKHNLREILVREFNLNSNAEIKLYLNRKMEKEVDISGNAEILLDFKCNSFFCDIKKAVERKVDEEKEERKYDSLFSKEKVEHYDEYFHCSCENGCSICLKNIRLREQKYRAVDHITFDSNLIVALLNSDHCIILTGYYRSEKQRVNCTVDGYFFPKQTVVKNGFSIEEEDFTEFENILRKTERQIVGIFFKGRTEIPTVLEINLLSQLQQKYYISEETFERERGRTGPVFRQNISGSYFSSLFFCARIVAGEVKIFQVIDSYPLLQKTFKIAKENVFLSNRVFEYVEDKKLVESKKIPPFYFIIPIPGGMKDCLKYLLNNNLLFPYCEEIFQFKKYLNQNNGINFLLLFRNLNICEFLNRHFKISPKKFLENINREEFFMQWSDKWSCKNCTYLNSGGIKCAMCESSK